MILVFDCETILDTSLIKDTFKIDAIDELNLCIKAQKIYEQKNNTSFLPLPYHKIVAIAGVLADDYGRFIRVGNFAENSNSEKELIATFLEYLDKNNPRLVSFNGRAFDLPVIMLRALKYNLSCPAFFEIENRELNKNKWENYKSRYSENFHTDLLDSLTHFGAVRGLRLDIICKMCELPGKYDVAGDDVLRLYHESKLEKIQEYCQSDVLNTYWLFLKYELLKGMLSINDYKELLSIFLQKLPKDRSYSSVFVEYLKKELTRI